MSKILFSIMLLVMSISLFANDTFDQIQGLIKQKIIMEQENKSDQHKFRNDSWDYKLVLFYSSACPHCQRFAPIVWTYGSRHHIRITAYTTGNNTLPAFPRSQRPTSAVMMTYFPNLGQRVVPALFLKDNYHHIFPVSIGEMSYQALSMRVHILLQHISEFNRKHMGVTNGI